MIQNNHEVAVNASKLWTKYLKKLFCKSVATFSSRSIKNLTNLSPDIDLQRINFAVTETIKKDRHSALIKYLKRICIVYVQKPNVFRLRNI